MTVKRETRWICPLDNFACDCGKARGCTGNMPLLPIVEDFPKKEKKK